MPMYKLLSILIIPFVLLVSLPVNASVLDYEMKLNEIEQQRKEVKEKLANANDSEIIELSREENRLIAHKEAYEKALEIENGSYNSSILTNFVPIDLKPGQSVPKEYVPYYQAAAARFGIDWFVLAAIHDIETTYSTNPSMVSTVGAIGHFQFMPTTFKAYGVDGNEDGVKSPWNLQDAIFSAANYLTASGYKKDRRKAIWHYNHAEWYVNDVIATAERIQRQWLQ